MKKCLPLLALVILIGSIILAGCSPQPGKTATPTTAPSTVIILPTNTILPENTPQFALPDLPTAVARTLRLDPALAKDTDTLLLSGLVYDGLTRLDSAGNPQPALAVGWTISDDKLDYILTLRQGIAFQNGDAFNADAVLANFNRWFDPANVLHGKDAFTGWETYFLGYKGDLDSNLQPISPFDGIEKVNNYTVLIHLNRAVPDLMTRLAQPYFLMLDPGSLTAAGSNYGTTSTTVNGTGAYKVSSWTESGLDFAPNPSYWSTVPTDSLHFNWK